MEEHHKLLEKVKNNYSIQISNYLKSINILFNESI